MARVVRPGALVGINEATVDPAAPDELLALFAEHPAIYRSFTPDALRTLFEGAGLAVEHLQEGCREASPRPSQGMAPGQMLSTMLRVYLRIAFKGLLDRPGPL
jgi:hypothetical protein